MAVCDLKNWTSLLSALTPTADPSADSNPTLNPLPVRTTQQQDRVKYIMFIWMVAPLGPLTSALPRGTSEAFSATWGHLISFQHSCGQHRGENCKLHSNRSHKSAFEAFRCQIPSPRLRSGDGLAVTVAPLRIHLLRARQKVGEEGRGVVLGWPPFDRYAVWPLL